MTIRAVLWLALLTLGLVTALPGVTVAQGAGDLVVTPTRVVFENRTRSAQVTLANRGSATATFRISLIDMVMDEAGQMSEIPAAEGQSAASLVRYAPRQIDIAPGAHQVVRLSLRKPANLADGEYRSHMFFHALPPESAGRSITDETGLENNELRIQLIPIYGVTIPVIVRQGSLSLRADITDTVHLPTSGDMPERMEITLNRDGETSAFGDLVATYQPADGSAEIVVGQINRIAVYTPNTKRKVVMILQVPDGVSLKSGGVLQVTYRATETEGGKVIAQQSVTLN